MKQKPYHTKDSKSLRRAVKFDSHPISLIMLELTSLSPSMDKTEAFRLAKLLVSLAKDLIVFIPNIKLGR